MALTNWNRIFTYSPCYGVSYGVEMYTVSMDRIWTLPLVECVSLLSLDTEAAICCDVCDKWVYVSRDNLLL